MSDSSCSSGYASLSRYTGSPAKTEAASSGPCSCVR
jgi:hypothetical protein